MDRAVISASRRTDLIRCHAGLLAGWVRAGCVTVANPFNGRERRVDLRPEAVHSLVLWSKDFSPLLENRDGVRSALERYEQRVVQCTVTGLGQSAWEPGVPSAETVLAQWPRLVAWTGDRRRVRWRFDPVVVWRDGRAVRSNARRFADLAPRAADTGLETVTVSFCQWYAKARVRTHDAGLRGIDPSPASRRRLARWLAQRARIAGLTLAACSQPEWSGAGVPAARCIDSDLLEHLHPRGLHAPGGKDRGQRRDCGCTPSVDIGSYHLACAQGCRYCYARPA